MAKRNSKNSNTNANTNNGQAITQAPATTPIVALALPLPERAEQGSVAIVLADNGRTEVVHSGGAITMSDSRRLLTLERATFTAANDAMVELAGEIGGDAQAKAIAAAELTRSKIRSVLSGEKGVVSKDGTVNGSVVMARAQKAQDRATSKGKDADEARDRSVKASLRKAAIIERNAEVYAATMTAVSVATSARDAIREARKARKLAQSENRKLSTTEKEAIASTIEASKVVEATAQAASTMIETADPMALALNDSALPIGALMQVRRAS